jgi:hypothetical protein
MQIETMLATVAAEAYKAVNEVYAEYIAINEGDELALEYCELYLYVALDGRWSIDHTQYFTSAFTVFACAPIAQYADADALYEELLLNADYVLAS